MRRTAKEQRHGITRLNNAFGGITAIMDGHTPSKDRRRKAYRRRIVLKYGG